MQPRSVPQSVSRYMKRVDSEIATVYRSGVGAEVDRPLGTS